jgi:hypothetical protein
MLLIIGLIVASVAFAYVDAPNARSLPPDADAGDRFRVLLRSSLVLPWNYYFSQPAPRAASLVHVPVNPDVDVKTKIKLPDNAFNMRLWDNNDRWVDENVKCGIYDLLDEFDAAIVDKQEGDEVEAENIFVETLNVKPKRE